MNEHTINVALNGRHYFKIVIPAGTTEAKAKVIAEGVRSRYPEFQVALSRWTTVGHEVVLAKQR